MGSNCVAIFWPHKGHFFDGYIKVVYSEVSRNVRAFYKEGFSDFYGWVTLNSSVSNNTYVVLRSERFFNNSCFWIRYTFLYNVPVRIDRYPCMNGIKYTAPWI